jgi:hypothetical protein
MLKITSSHKKSLYESDYYLWLDTTLQQLKNNDLTNLDLVNLIEEIETLGRKERAELLNRLIVLFEHLLKLKYWQQELARNKRGWNNTVIEQTNQIEILLEDSPSLKSSLNDIVDRAYSRALKVTKKKTGLANLPENNPFKLQDIIEY